MTPIFIAADSDDRFFKAIQNAVGQKLSVILSGKRRFDMQKQGAKYLIADLDDYDTVCCEKALVIFKDAQRGNPKRIEAKQGIAIVNSQDVQLLAEVSQTRLPAVTCGLSPRDTVTLSSIDIDSAVINVQRQLYTIDGVTVEPQEIPVKLSMRMDQFTIMAIAAVYILTGNTEKLTQMEL